LRAKSEGQGQHELERDRRQEIPPEWKRTHHQLCAKSRVSNHFHRGKFTMDGIICSWQVGGCVCVCAFVGA